MKKHTGSWCIKNGRVVDPSEGIDDIRDVVISGGQIADVRPPAGKMNDGDIDARGMIVMPGIVDMHVHLREPGREDKETVASGTRAAAAAGVTSMMAMPNTNPPMDTPEHVRMLKGIIGQSAHAEVSICGCMTRGRAGREVVDIAALKDAGISAVSDDGSSVEDERVMEEVLRRARQHGVRAVCHCEDIKLAADGVVNRGFTSTRMGLRGISRESEFRRVARDIALAKTTGASIHIAHVSCRESVQIIGDAQRSGIDVSAETAPHYFVFSESDVWGFDPNFKMNPPLRAREDVEALREGLAAGVIGVIASDHAPHTENEKEIEFERAEFGVIGVETLLAASIAALIVPGVLSWPALVERLCRCPARILGLKKGTLAKGRDADIVVVDPDVEYVYSRDAILSQSKNSPFIGTPLKGKAMHTILKGRAYSCALPS